MRARLYAGLAVLLSTVAAGAQSIPFDMTPELGRPAASGQPQTQPSQGTNPQPLPTVADRQRRYLLPFPEFVLSGETARRSWAIYLTQQEAASPAGLRIGYQNAVVVAPEISHLVLSISIAHLAPAVAPEHHLQRRDDFTARVHGALPPGIDVAVIEMKLQRVALRLLMRVTMFGKGVAQHQRRAVDVEVYVHGAAFFIRRIGKDLLRAEGLLVEFGSLEGAVHLQIGGQSTQHFCPGLNGGLVSHVLLLFAFGLALRTIGRMRSRRSYMAAKIFWHRAGTRR